MVIFILICLTFACLLLMSPEPRLSPDGSYYLNRPNVMPYVMRGIASTRLVKFKNPIKSWAIINYSATFLTAIILEYTQFGAGFLFLGLASTRTNIIFPVLTDQLGILFLTLGYFIHPIFFTLGGLFNEKTPLIGALINPLYGLFGLVFPLINKIIKQEPLKDYDPIWLKHPFKTALVKLRSTPPYDLVLPWGVAAVGLFYVPIYLVLIAYLPLLVAQDRARVYQWISPMVCVMSATVIGPTLLPFFIIIHFLNPWRQTL